jgi:hypothetical protein
VKLPLLEDPSIRLTPIVVELKECFVIGHPEVLDVKFENMKLA